MFRAGLYARVSDDAIDAYAMGHLDPAFERHLFLCNPVLP
jgi:hypothetical protein